MAERNKARYDKSVRASTLHKGDRVLVRSIRLRGKNQLADKWEGVVYVVVDQHGDLPVYKVCPETQTGPIRTLHRDLLLPCGTLPSEIIECESQSPVPKRKTRSEMACRRSNMLDPTWRRARTQQLLSPDRTVFSCFLSCKSQFFCTSSSRLPVFKRAYSREFLLDVGRTTFLELNSAHAGELRDLGLLRRPTPSPTPTTASRPQRRRYKRREKKQKRGKRGGIRARLAANPHKPAIPTIVLANVRSLDNKLDYIRLLRSAQRTVRDCCVFVFTETWLNNSVPDCAIQLDQLTCYRADRALVEGGKSRGGGLCVYINDAWWRNAVVVCKHCSPLVEFMIIKCRPFYLPREYTAILLVAVYIPPSSTTNRSEALNDLYQHISEQQTAHPDAFLILAWDFNHCRLKECVQKLTNT